MCTHSYFQVIMYFRGGSVGSEMVSPAAKVSHAEIRSNGQPRSNAMVNGQPFAHARLLKVQSLFDRPRSIGQR